MAESLACTELTRYLAELLELEAFQDYCPNGLQVQGKRMIRRLVTGVTASLACIEAAAAWHADALLVHHGFFWHGEAPEIVGVKYRRVQALLAAQMNLLVYHLPLDAHPLYGNNQQLASRLGLVITGLLAPEQPRLPGNIGHFDQSLTLEAVAQRVELALGRVPLVIANSGMQGSDDKRARFYRVAWCTGAAQSYFEQAIAVGVDLFITGEISEPMVHLARETGVAYVAAGHHATERYGVMALGQHLSEHFGLEVEFIDVDSPV